MRLGCQNFVLCGSPYLTIEQASEPYLPSVAYCTLYRCASDVSGSFKRAWAYVRIGSMLAYEASGLHAGVQPKWEFFNRLERVGLLLDQPVRIPLRIENLDR